MEKRVGFLGIDYLEKLKIWGGSFPQISLLMRKKDQQKELVLQDLDQFLKNKIKIDLIKKKQ